VERRRDLRIRQPREVDGVGWLVYDELTSRIVDPGATQPGTDAIAVERRMLEWMTAGQRDVWVFNNLRREVNADGFDAYFLWHADSAPLAPSAALRFGGEPWRDLVVEAMATVGDPFPTDWDQRERRMFELAEANDRSFDALDAREHDLEADAPVDPVIDAFIWADPDSFFVPEPWFRRRRNA
jgi:hypothetical protein